jgi:hypothetical protein
MPRAVFTSVYGRIGPTSALPDSICPSPRPLPERELTGGGIVPHRSSSIAPPPHPSLPPQGGKEPLPTRVSRGRGGIGVCGLLQCRGYGTRERRGGIAEGGGGGGTGRSWLMSSRRCGRASGRPSATTIFNNMPGRSESLLRKRFRRVSSQAFSSGDMTFCRMLAIVSSVSTRYKSRRRRSWRCPKGSPMRCVL